MKAIIRISPFIPDAGLPPFFGKDKKQMIDICNKSFKAAGSDDIDKIYMLDRCPDSWAIEFAKDGQIYRGEWGKKESLYRALEIGRKTKDDVLFLEDDYLWRPNTLQPLMEGLNQFGMVSPYDHPDWYAPGEVTATGICVLSGRTWRRCYTNTHTFAIKGELLDKYWDDFHFGLFDWQMYMKLSIDGVICYVPTASFATHLVEGKLAYNIDWGELIERYKNE